MHNKPFFEQPAKSKQEAYEKLVEMSKTDDCITEDSLNVLYHQKYYELVGADLSRQLNKSIPQQINITGKSEEDDGTKMFLIIGKQQKTFSKLFFRFINSNRIM